jgi:hypothetical protein
MNTEANITPETAPANSEPPTKAKRTRNVAAKKASKSKKVTTKKNVKAATPKKGDEAVKLRPDGLREGSAGGLLVDTVCRKQGATHAELVEALGWPGGQCLPYLMKVVKQAGVKLRKQKEAGQPMRYFGARSKSRARA